MARTNTGEDRDPLDRCYAPNVLAHALLAHWISLGLIAPGDLVLDAGAGTGAFEKQGRVLRLQVDAVDLDPVVCAQYGWTEVDFLALPAGRAYKAVLGNPPFSIAEAFIEQGLDLAPTVLYLLPHLFLGSAVRHKNGLWRKLSRFDPLVERAGFTGPGVKPEKQGKGGQTSHAGCAFSIDHKGDFRGRHLSWGGMRAERRYLKSLNP